MEMVTTPSHWLSTPVISLFRYLYPIFLHTGESKQLGRSKPNNVDKNIQNNFNSWAAPGPSGVALSGPEAASPLTLALHFIPKASVSGQVQIKHEVHSKCFMFHRKGGVLWKGLCWR